VSLEGGNQRVFSWATDLMTRSDISESSISKAIDEQIRLIVDRLATATPVRLWKSNRA